MQPLNSPGASPPVERVTLIGTTGQARVPEIDDQPLTSVQRTTLERLITRIMSLSTLKAGELWASLRHEVGITNNGELLSQHFPAAQDFLTTRLAEVQSHQEGRQLMQQLTSLLPQGNNRQAVSDFIRQQFGHTVLSALTVPQLRQVLTLLQQGEIIIPPPQFHQSTDRTLLPAEHQALSQQVVKLVATTGEKPPEVWDTLRQMLSLKEGDPVPARHFPLLNQYLQTRQTLSQHPAPTLIQLEAALKQPPTPHEREQLENWTQQAFQLTPDSVLTPTQAQDLLMRLFAHRAGQAAIEPDLHSKTPGIVKSHQALFLLQSWLPPSLQPLAARPGVLIVAAFILTSLLLAIFL